MCVQIVQFQNYLMQKYLSNGVPIDTSVIHSMLFFTTTITCIYN